jgi:hypothetical protein
MDPKENGSLNIRRLFDFPVVEMNEQAPALTSADYENIVRSLDDVLAVFDRHTGKLNLTEIHTKSILAALRAEMLERQMISPQSLRNESGQGVQ